jgi:hypothetical protein
MKGQGVFAQGVVQNSASYPEARLGSNSFYPYDLSLAGDRRDRPIRRAVVWDGDLALNHIARYERRLKNAVEAAAAQVLGSSFNCADRSA